MNEPQSPLESQISQALRQTKPESVDERFVLRVATRVGARERKRTIVLWLFTVAAVGLAAVLVAGMTITVRAWSALSLLTFDSAAVVAPVALASIVMLLVSLAPSPDVHRRAL